MSTLISLISAISQLAEACGTWFGVLLLIGTGIIAYRQLAVSRHSQRAEATILALELISTLDQKQRRKKIWSLP